MKCNMGKMCKKFLSLCLAAGLLCGSIPVIPVYAASDIMVFVDGEYLSADVPPYTKNGYTMLPMRAVYESLGAEVVYEKTNKQITAYKDQNIITLFVDKKVAYVNGSAIPLSAAPEIKNGRTMVGLRDGATLIGADIEWDSVSRTVNVWTEEDLYYEEEYYEDDWHYEDEEYNEDDWYYEDDEYYEDDWYYEDDEYYSFNDIKEGEWWDLDSQRCHLTITKTGPDTAEIVVGWSSSAYETTVWGFDCEWDSTAGILWYEDGEMAEHYSDRNDPSNKMFSNLVYDDGTGYFYLDDGYLYWVDETEDAGRDCYFEHTSYSNAVTWEEEENCDDGHTRGAFLYTDSSHPHYKYYECEVCYEEFTDSSKGTMDSCTICNPVNEGYWSDWSGWSTNKVTASSTRRVETREVKVSDAYTQYRYGRYVDSTGKHDCWCSKYFKSLSYSGISLQYSDWSKTRYSTKGSDWTCGYCTGSHIGVHHTSSDGRDWWREYNVGGDSYYWEESRSVAAKYETQYRYSDWVD